jgi:hypothetical protein
MMRAPRHRVDCLRSRPARRIGGKVAVTTLLGRELCAEC